MGQSRSVVFDDIVGVVKFDFDLLVCWPFSRVDIFCEKQISMIKWKNYELSRVPHF